MVTGDSKFPPYMIIGPILGLMTMLSSLRTTYALSPILNTFIHEYNKLHYYRYDLNFQVFKSNILILFFYNDKFTIKMSFYRSWNKTA